ncbi:MAG TPA: sialidase family protein [Thermoguttaceae bacterium]|nr:sialidase family protein [Thermoguttaceae bacterium]
MKVITNMKNRFLTLALLAAVAGGAVPRCLAAEDGHFVVDGVANDVRIVGKQWTADNGALVCAGEGTFLYAAKQLGPGDFTVEASLSVEQLAKSAASLVFNDSHLGFEGSGGTMFTEGNLLGNHNLGQPVVEEDKPFDLVATRRGDVFSIAIDGRPVVTTKVASSESVTVGLRPWRSTMRVSRFTATGNLVDPPQPLPHTDIFVSGEGDYHTYRIPAIVVTKRGTLLAFCEGRKTGRGDAGNIDMLVSRSTDLGKTWSKPLIIWDDGDSTCGNPAPVVDQETGVVWLPMTWNLGSDHEGDIMAGRSQQPRHAYITHSDDDGLSWAEPKKISDAVRLPHWRWYATGPGNAIQLTRGEHQGRLLIPANHSDHSDPETHPYRSHVFWSDDHGQTWQLGGIHEDRVNESAVVELTDGSILQAMRSYHGQNKRAMSVSHDGGKTWGPLYLDDTLETPVCQANILRYSWPEDADRGSKSRILFSSPRGSSRSKMTVWLSYDEGKTWPVSKLIYPGGSAYSNLVALPDGRIGVLYEKDGYRTISLATFDLEWLEGE